MAKRKNVPLGCERSTLMGAGRIRLFLRFSLSADERSRYEGVPKQRRWKIFLPKIFVSAEKMIMQLRSRYLGCPNHWTTGRPSVELLVYRGFQLEAQCWVFCRLNFPCCHRGSSVHLGKGTSKCDFILDFGKFFMFDIKKWTYTLRRRYLVSAGRDYRRLGKYHLSAFVRAQVRNCFTRILKGGCTGLSVKSGGDMSRFLGFVGFGRRRIGSAEEIMAFNPEHSTAGSNISEEKASNAGASPCQVSDFIWHLNAIRRNPVIRRRTAPRDALCSSSDGAADSEPHNGIRAEGALTNQPRANPFLASSTFGSGDPSGSGTIRHIAEGVPSSLVPDQCSHRSLLETNWSFDMVRVLKYREGLKNAEANMNHDIVTGKATKADAGGHFTKGD
ncbi:unnamed protein product [Nesidiocoris tenuis]|uniref:Uncharacterized protein n=1 Tax=Nesidiocoris tenuis TaxID=355587 RepID=A0A6H5G1S3_9HEMI|nr:unnamed protein product [Nesidiocoris tenuis]